MPPVSMIGVPWDEHSSFLQGPALAPAAIHAALFTPSSNASTESGLDLVNESRLLTDEDGSPAREESSS